MAKEKKERKREKQREREGRQRQREREERKSFLAQSSSALPSLQFMQKKKIPVEKL